MTVRFLALHQTPADPEAFDRHHRNVHIPLGRIAVSAINAWICLICAAILITKAVT